MSFSEQTLLPEGKECFAFPALAVTLTVRAAAILGVSRVHALMGNVEVGKSHSRVILHLERNCLQC